MNLDPDAGVPRPGRGPGQEEIDGWINEAEQLADTAEPQDANMCRGQLMTSLLALGLYRRAADLRSKVDFAVMGKVAGLRRATGGYLGVVGS